MARRCFDIDFASRSSILRFFQRMSQTPEGEMRLWHQRLQGLYQVGRCLSRIGRAVGKSLYQVARTTNVSSRHENCQGERRASRAGCTLPVALLPGPVWCKDCVSCILYRCRLLAELRQGDIAHWSASKGLKVKGLPSRRERPYGAHVETTQPSESTT